MTPTPTYNERQLCARFAKPSLGRAFWQLANTLPTFALLWLAGYLGLPHLPYLQAMFTPYVAALAIALVFIVLKGDVRLN